MEPVVFRTLHREFRLHPPNEDYRQRLRFMETMPTIVGRRLEPVDIRPEASWGFLAVRLPNGHMVHGSSLHLLGALHPMVLQDTLSGFPSAPLVHGATVRIGGRRLLLVGNKAVGKTTLCLHLLAKGHRVEGDEHLVVLDDGVMARPRSLRVKPGSFAVVRNLPAAIADTPAVPAWDGTPIHAVSPALFGTPWEIEQGVLDGLVFLEANRGGGSSIAPLSTDRGFRRLMREVVLPRTGIAAASALLRRSLVAVPNFILSVGDLDRAQFHLEVIARRLTERVGKGIVQLSESGDRDDATA